MISSTSLTQPVALRKRTAFAVLFVVGMALVGALLLDIYADGVQQGDPIWTTVLENTIPTLLALILVGVGWRLFARGGPSIYLSEATKYALVGCVGMIAFSGLIISLHVFQEEIKPGVLILQLSTVGAVAGLWVGHTLARVRQAEQKTEDERDRLANLLDGLPSPVVHGRFDGKNLTILRANCAFADVFGRENATIEGENLYDLVVPKEQHEEAREIDRKAIQEGLVEKEVWRHTHDGLRNFQLRVAQALDDGAAETYAIYTDVTERKRREEELKQVQELAELALDHTNSLIFGLDLETGTVWRRGPFTEFFGVEPSEVDTLESFLTTAVHPADRDTFEAFYRQFTDGTKTSGELEYRTNPEQGDMRWIRDNVHVDETDPPQLLGLAQEVTERKIRETELRQKERRYQAVFDDPNILVGLLTPEGRVLDINRTAMEYIDPELDAIQDDPLWSTPWFEGDPAVQNDLREWVQRAAEGEYVEFDVDLSHAVDHPLMIEGVLRPVTDENGTVTSLLISDRDVTERKAKERELHLFKEVIEQANDAVLITDGRPIDKPGPKITYANPAFEEMTGYSRDEVVGRTPRILQGPDTNRAVLDSLRSALESGESWSGETVNYRKDDTPYILRWNVAPVEGADGTIEHWMSVQRDVTDDRKREEELIEAKEEAEKASQLKSAMLANMSHELRTPLTSITGFSEILVEQLDDDLHEFATRIHDSSQRLQETLESVLHLSKLEAGVTRLEREPVRLTQVVKTVTSELCPRAEENGVAVNRDLPNRPVQGRWNEDALRRICRNLVENAIKFTPEDGRINVQVRATDAEAQLIVEDSGIGMNPASVPELFKAFKQESEGLDREYGGSGLGLSIVDRLVDGLNGEIDVETEKGVGSCFTIRFPRQPSE